MTLRFQFGPQGHVYFVTVDLRSLASDKLASEVIFLADVKDYIDPVETYIQLYLKIVIGQTSSLPLQTEDRRNLTATRYHIISYKKSEPWGGRSYTIILIFLISYG